MNNAHRSGFVDAVVKLDKFKCMGCARAQACLSCVYEHWFYADNGKLEERRSNVLWRLLHDARFAAAAAAEQASRHAHRTNGIRKHVEFICVLRKVFARVSYVLSWNNIFAVRIFLERFSRKCAWQLVSILGTTFMHSFIIFPEVELVCYEI